MTMDSPGQGLLPAFQSALLATVILVSGCSCTYVHNRVSDFCDIFKAKVGFSYSGGVRIYAFGLLDTGLGFIQLPEATSIGLDYGQKPSGAQDMATGMLIGDEHRNWVFFNQSYYQHDQTTGSYLRRRSDYAALPFLLSWCRDSSSFLQSSSGTMIDDSDLSFLWDTSITMTHSRIHAFDFEISCAFLATIDIGLSPGEFVDFVLGWFGVDIASDDM
jgi:hypothetical protein